MVCETVGDLSNILLKQAQSQSLVQFNLASVPDLLQLAVMCKHLQIRQRFHHHAVVYWNISHQTMWPAANLQNNNTRKPDASCATHSSAREGYYLRTVVVINNGLLTVIRITISVSRFMTDDHSMSPNVNYWCQSKSITHAAAANKFIVQ